MNPIYICIYINKLHYIQIYRPNKLRNTAVCHMIFFYKGVLSKDEFYSYFGKKRKELCFHRQILMIYFLLIYIDMRS